MKTLITGSNGFVGSYLVNHCQLSGDQVLGCVAPADRRPSSVPTVAWDLAGPIPAETEQSIRQFAPDWIVHLGGISLPSACGDRQPTSLATRVNVESWPRLLDLAVLCGVSATLFASSAHVYGPKSELSQVDESSDLNPQSGYAQSKFHAERSVLQRTVPCRVIIARPFNHSGPGQQPPMLLPAWAQQFADPTCDPVHVHTLNAWLDLCDVRDVVQAYRRLLNSTATGIFNVGSGRPVRTAELLEKFVEVSGARRQVVESRPGERHSPIANCQRIFTEVGWRADLPIEQTVEDTYQYWVRQRSVDGD